MTMPEPEFSLMIDLRQINDVPLTVEPDEPALRRLAGRFGLTEITRMRAEVVLEREGDRVTATGRLTADVIQPCRISGEDFPVSIDEPVALRFVPPIDAAAPDEEIELTADDLDEIEYDGTAFDLGEALAQTLALAIDPFAEGPNADAFRAEHDLNDSAPSGPFAALAALKKD